MSGQNRLVWLAAVSLALGAVSCHKTEKKAHASPKATATPAPKPAPAPPKKVPQDIKAFVAWAQQAGKAIEAGPKPTSHHPVLGRITCQHDKKFDDYGWCSSSKEGTPRYAGEWLEKQPSVWSVKIMRDPTVAWLDCAALGTSAVRNSVRGKVITHWCRSSGATDIWLRHYAGGSDSNTQVAVFARDFPQKDAPSMSARAARYWDLMH